MAEVYTPIPGNNPSAYTVPEDGDTKPVASIRVALEGLADKAAHINWPAVDNTKRYPLASRSLRRTQLNQWAFNPADCADGVTLTGGGVTLLDGLVMNTIGCQAFLPLDLPDLSVLTALDICLQGAAGHGSLPAGTDRFNIQIFIGQAGPGNPATQIVTAQYDTTVGTGNYEFEHIYTVTLGSPITMDRSIDRIVLMATNEKGANFIAGLRVCEIATIITVTSQDPGAA